MIRYFGQAQYSPKRILMGYELFLRERVAQQWRFPANLRQYGARELTQLAQATIAVLEPAAKIVSINLDQDQFIDPDFVQMFAQLAAQFPERIIVVELTEHECGGALAALRQAARQYVQHHVYVCLDDVGSGANGSTMASVLNEFVTEYKFALQNFSERDGSVADLLPQLATWAQRAKQDKKEFVVEGIETTRNLKIVEQFTPNLIQGYLFAKPVLIPVAGDIF